MTTTLLIYDIPDDRLRSKVADACLDYGLDPEQRNALGHIQGCTGFRGGVRASGPATGYGHQQRQLQPANAHRYRSAAHFPETRPQDIPQ